MNNILLVTRPKYDDGTEYLSYYASLILKESEKLNVKTKDFEGKNVTSKNIKKFVTKKDPKLLFINGHGNKDFLEGDKGKILFSINKGIELLKDRIVYARACHAGISFGKKMVEKNNGCFIGYNNPFSFWISGERSATPAKDEIAKLFLEPSNEIINLLIKGNTTGNSNEKSKKMMIENMNKVLKMEEKKEPGAMSWLEILWNNYEGQVLHGNEGASF